jgi:hypothetical protein
MGMFKDISRTDGVDLLWRNAELLLARFAVHEVEGRYVVVTSLDCFLDTLLPQDLTA